MDQMTMAIALHADEVFRGDAWHGASLWPTLRKLSWEQARAPSPFEGFTAWGVALHTAYWKHRGGLLLAKNSQGAVEWPRFFRGPADWPAVPDGGEAPEWAEDLARIEEVHERWMAALKAFPVTSWDQPVRGDGLKASSLALGVSAHDVYHTAQIRNMGVRGF